MDYLIDYISILGCGSPESLSGLYINSLPGIPLMSIDKIANSDQKTFLGVWKDVQKRGVKRILTETTSLFQKRYQLKSINRSVNMGRVIKLIDPTAADTRYRGFTMEQDLAGTDYVASNLQAISVQSLCFYALAGASNVDFKIFDLDTAQELFTRTMNVENGWNVINVEQDFTARGIFCCYNATALSGVTLAIPPAIATHWCHCVASYYEGACGTIKGAMSADIATILPDTFGENTFGLSGIFSLTCSYENLICENRKKFATALWYLLGAELMIERLYTPRINWWKINQDETNDLVNLFTSRAQDELEQVVNGINLDLNDACLVCNQPLKIKEAQL